MMLCRCLQTELLRDLEDYEIYVSHTATIIKTLNELTSCGKWCSSLQCGMISSSEAVLQARDAAAYSDHLRWLFLFFCHLFVVTWSVATGVDDALVWLTTSTTVLYFRLSFRSLFLADPPANSLFWFTLTSLKLCYFGHSKLFIEKALKTHRTLPALQQTSRQTQLATTL